jgi:hypothetical protein
LSQSAKSTSSNFLGWLAELENAQRRGLDLRFHFDVQQLEWLEQFDKWLETVRLMNTVQASDSKIKQVQKHNLSL